MNYILKNEFYEMTVSSLGAEMVSLKNYRGEELLWQNTTGKGWSDHAPILFPFAGRLFENTFYYKDRPYPMGIHGFASKSEFTLIESNEKRLVFLFKSDEETFNKFPFDFELTVTYTLSNDEITLSCDVKNTGEEILPYMFGWHPGFVLPTENGQDIEDYAIKFDGKKEVTWVNFYKDYMRPSDLIPYPTPNSEYKLCEEEIYSHDTMIFLGAGNHVRLKADGHPFELDFSWSENLPVLCIWKAPTNESKFVCIEPWTHTTARGEKSNHLEVRPMNRLAGGKVDSYEYKLKFKF